MKKTSIILTLIIIFALTPFAVQNVGAVVVATENTFSLCTDTLDNDGDLSTDSGDSDCTPFASGLENTLALCTDILDNDGDLSIDAGDSDCTAILIPVVIPVENTLILCTDGIDNDNDLGIDLGDSDCTPFASTIFPPTEDTLVLCTDGIDNDNDLGIDLGDSDCTPFAPVIFPPATTTEPVATTTPTTTTTVSGGFSGPSFGSGVSSSGTGFSSGLTSGTPISNIIATTTDNSTCDDVFTTYIKKGQKNDVNEVKKLQNLLNENLNLNLPITGFYGDMTFNAVKKFQLKYLNSVLSPWGINYATGYFYKTTQAQANLLLCSVN